MAPETSTTCSRTPGSTKALFRKRMKHTDDYLTVRAANPATGLVSPSVGSSSSSLATPPTTPRVRSQTGPTPAKSVSHWHSRDNGDHIDVPPPKTRLASQSEQLAHDPIATWNIPRKPLARQPDLSRPLVELAASDLARPSPFAAVAASKAMKATIFPSQPIPPGQNRVTQTQTSRHSEQSDSDVDTIFLVLLFIITRTAWVYGFIRTTTLPRVKLVQPTSLLGPLVSSTTTPVERAKALRSALDPLGRTMVLIAALFALWQLVGMILRVVRNIIAPIVFLISVARWMLMVG